MEGPIGTNTEEGRAHLERYQVSISQGLEGGPCKPVNMAKPTEVVQKETELYEILRDL